MTARGAVLRRINWLKAGNLGGHKACRENAEEVILQRNRAIIGKITLIGV